MAISFLGRVLRAHFRLWVHCVTRTCFSPESGLVGALVCSHASLQEISPLCLLVVATSTVYAPLLVARACSHRENLTVVRLDYIIDLFCQNENEWAESAPI